MTTTFAPFGLEPARRQGSNSNSTGLTQFRILNGLGGNIFYGDPVMFHTSNNGTVVVCSTSAGVPVGVFYGCVYNNPNLNDQPRFSPFWPASTSVTDGSQPYALVCDDPQQTFYIQADASVSVGDINFDFSVTISAGTTRNGRSKTALNATSRVVHGFSSVANSNKLVTVKELKDFPGNVFGDLYPIVEVQWVKHAYQMAGI